MTALAIICLAGGVLLIPGLAGIFLDRARDVIMGGLDYADLVLSNIQ